MANRTFLITWQRVNKANNTAGTVRTFVHLGLDIYKVLYTALVRPNPECENEIWCPYLIKATDIIENMQWRATKLVAEIKHLEYGDRVKEVNFAYSVIQTILREHDKNLYKIMTSKYDEDCMEGLFWRKVTQERTPRKYS